MSAEVVGLGMLPYTGSKERQDMLACLVLQKRQCVG